MNVAANFLGPLVKTELPDPLLNFTSADYWLRLLEDAHSRDIYPYQLPLSSRQGNHVESNSHKYLLVSAYDYLGLLGHPAINHAAMEAIKRFGTGTAGVRLLTGTLDLHVLLENAIADFTKKEAAITFSSGYAANLSLLAALITPKDEVFADQYIHRSLVEGLHLTKAPVNFYRHNDSAHLEALLKNSSANGRRFILSEGVFSMEGDTCRLGELIELRNRYNGFLILDEAHSIGMLGRGISFYENIKPDEVDIITGSLSKAIPAQGGFVAGSLRLIQYLQHAAAGYIFSSALNPPSILAALTAIELIRQEPVRGKTALLKGYVLRQKLNDAGFSTGNSNTAIVPVHLDNQEMTLQVTAQLKKQNIIASPILYPAVPRHKTRLRLCTSIHFEDEQMDELVAAMRHAV